MIDDTQLRQMREGVGRDVSDGVVRHVECRQVVPQARQEPGRNCRKLTVGYVQRHDGGVDEGGISDGRELIARQVEREEVDVNERFVGQSPDSVPSQ